MESQIKTCQNCKCDFTIEPDDFSFYEKMNICVPNFCPTCRSQLRLSFRNGRVFYKRKCDKCKKDSISRYSPNKPFTIYCYDCWFSDDWDCEDYGVDYDREKPFFEQFEELLKKVPQVGLVYVRSPGSEYLNLTADSKNCYMIMESSNNENSINSYWIQECRDVVDTSFASKCELTYESDDCYNSYKLLYSKGCHDCATSYFLTDCKGCIDCIGCINLINKKNYIFNESYSKEDYEEIKKELELDTYKGVVSLREKYQEFILKYPRKFAEVLKVLNSTGNYMKNTKNCKNCFHCYDAEDNKYGFHIWRNAKDTMDCDTAGRNVSLIYNSINAGIDDSNLISTVVCWTCSFVEYSMYCFNSNNCFGCVGLRKKNYCILNKQYSKEDYEEITNKIKNELKEKGIYGEFFAKNLSSFGYNETEAFNLYAKTKEEALEEGFSWEDTERGTYNRETIKIDDMPEIIKEIDFDVKDEIFVCESCSKNYKIIENEYLFYKKLDVPLPRLCPDCRHNRRIKSRGPNKLWRRACMHEGCTNTFETSYAPDRPEIIYCEKCYQNEVY